MKLIMLGAPGSGKGTQGIKLSEKYKIPLLSTGDILRAAVRDKTELGKKAGQYISKGELVPDDVIIALMTGRISESDCKEGYILDGFPRTIAQADALGKFLSGRDEHIDAVLNLIVEDEVIIGRLSGRRQCTKCSAVYHLEYSPPAKQGVCDKCGGSLYQRDDDLPETIKKRLSLYRKETAPLIGYYKKSARLIDISGAGTGSEIFSSISSLI